MDSLRRRLCIDSREQTPWRFPPEVSTVSSGLATGDYALEGLEHFAVVERKSLNDFVACCGWQRERFERELARLSLIPVRAVVIEATVDDIARRRYEGVQAPAAIMGSALAWMVDLGIHFVFAGNPWYAARCCYHLLLMAERRYEEQRRVLALRGCPEFADSANKHIHAPRRRRRAAK